MGVKGIVQPICLMFGLAYRQSLAKNQPWRNQLTMRRDSPQITSYIAAAPRDGQTALRQIRKLARQLCPDAEEVISYKIPAFKQGRVFLYFAAFKSHIGIYPPVKGSAKLMRELAPFTGPKGNLIFKYADGIPIDLVSKTIQALHKSYAIEK
jgi:uncharacterized protein YdhG (YjbR/CyaY superfamily)